ncbi:MAG TPA: PCYCGC motif-containing (lipo)protein [Dehalococcoidia bacterium]|nr:PCYCGC motif-containing (lipo)protein [Dehalococcoidia bacterium]
MKRLVWGALALEIAAVPVLAVLLALAMSGFGWGSDDSSATAEGPQFPDFVYNTQTSQDAYRLAVDNRQLFSQMPCYCGCSGLDMPHQNLDQCFFMADGSFEQHAAYCTICADIAVDAARWQSEGKTTAEIRRLVDDKFSDVGPGTNTPPVSQ